jgi:hypothetical protein
MKYIIVSVFMGVLAANAGVTDAAAGSGARSDPILKDSVSAITDPKEKAANTRLDPILGNSPVAITDRNAKEPKPIIPQYLGDHKNTFTKTRKHYFRSGKSIIHDVELKHMRQNGLLLLNTWRGDDYRITAGYLASNPMAGAVQIDALREYKEPIIVFVPTATGPLRILSVTETNGYLSKVTLRSQSGHFKYKDEPSGESHELIIKPENETTYYLDTQTLTFK